MSPRGSRRRSPGMVVSLVVAAAVLAGGPSTSSAAADEAVATFELPDLAGNTFSSVSRLSGKIAVVVFWRPGQPQSSRALSDLAALAPDYDSTQVQLVGIVRGDGETAAIERAVRAASATFPILRDRDDTVYGAFGVIVSPTTFFLDAAGVVRFKYPGYRRDYRANVRADLDFLLDKISAEQRTERTTNRAAPSWKGLAGGDARYRLAHKLLRQGKRDEARAQLKRAWKSDPPVVDAAVELGILALEDGRDKAALKLFRKVLARAPDDLRARAGKGVAMMRTGKRRAGLRLLRAVLDEHDVNMPLFYYEAGVACQDRDEMGPATRYFRRGLELALANRPAER